MILSYPEGLWRKLIYEYAGNCYVDDRECGCYGCEDLCGYIVVEEEPADHVDHGIYDLITLALDLEFHRIGLHQIVYRQVMDREEDHGQDYRQESKEILERIILSSGDL